MKTEHTKVRILQIIPAPPGTFVICRSFVHGEEESIPEKDRYFRVPVPAWGIWTQWKTLGTNVLGEREERIGFIERMAGPLVLTEFGELSPAMVHLESQFAGVRYGEYTEINGNGKYDNAESWVELVPAAVVPAAVPPKDNAR